MILSLVSLAVLSSCGEPRPPSTAEGDVCDLADDFAACPECADGDTTCTYGATTVTALSCQECQARGTLYQQLCDAGVTDSAAAVEDGTSCTTQPAF
jgi:hypothetical protein